MPQDHIVIHDVCRVCTYTAKGCICPPPEPTKPKKRGRPRKTAPKE